jgi:hypothetical protein
MARTGSFASRRYRRFAFIGGSENRPTALNKVPEADYRLNFLTSGKLKSPVSYENRSFELL